jgi:hypothetical protein
MKALLLFFSLLGPGSVMASDLDFTLVNQTGRSFEGLYISASSDKDWDGNLLPENKVLATDGSIQVKFAAKDNAATWDMNVVDADGVSVRFDAMKLPGADKVTLSTVDGKITAEVE